MSILSLRDLHVAHEGVAAVSNVSIELRQGEIVALVGANGAGKSSVLRAIVGLATKRGLVFLNGCDITGWPTERIVASGVSLVSESLELFPGMSCLDNLRVALFASNAEREFDERAAAVFQLFPRLSERLMQRAGTLSGGEQKMLAIARAMMQRPEVLLLDEPSSGLSPALTSEVFEAITRIRDAGRAVLIVEQRARLALETADRAYVMVVGQVVMDGAAGQLLRDPMIQRTYFGV